MRFSIRVVLTIVLLLFQSPRMLFSEIFSSDLQALISSGPSEAAVPVIITMADRVDLSRFTQNDVAVRRANIISALRNLADQRTKVLKLFLIKNGATGIRELWIINGLAAVLPAAALERLRNFPGIGSIRLDETVSFPEPLPAASAAVQWNIQTVQAPKLWDLGITGQGIVVANMDTGVDGYHSDLAGRWRGGTNSWFDPHGEHPAVPVDISGHGTGTMGIMVGGDATGSFIGMAPGAQWIAVKIFDDAGDSSSSVIHAGFQWLLDPDGDPSTNDAPNVVNNSWGYSTLADLCFLEFQEDIRILRAAGTAVVFSAGNEGPEVASSISPANNPGSFAVGAVSQSLNIAVFSSRGPSACIIEDDIYPEVVAPGVDVKTAGITAGGIIPQAAAWMTGTSAAAPHAAGAMALLMEAFPQMAPAELEVALKGTAADLGEAGPDDHYGYGMIDVLAAYRTLAGCTDADGDGFFAESLCGTAQDCVDGDQEIHPGATEIKHDGIDQDCNGYDLTIDITKAVYDCEQDSLIVVARSGLGKDAGLKLEGFGPMKWHSGSEKWRISVKAVEIDPEVVVVTGHEGSENAVTTYAVEPCRADLNSDGSVNILDYAIFVRDWGRTDCDVHASPCLADLSLDGSVNILDYAIFVQDYGRRDCPDC